MLQKTKMDNKHVQWLYPAKRIIPRKQWLIITIQTLLLTAHLRRRAGPLVYRRQHIVIGAQRHQQQERHRPQAQREVRQHLAQLVPVLAEEGQRQPVIGDQQHQGANERRRREAHKRKGAQDEGVHRLGGNAAAEQRPGQPVEEAEQHVDDDGGHHDVADDALRGDRVLFDQFGQVVDARNCGHLWEAFVM